MQRLLICILSIIVLVYPAKEAFSKPDRHNFPFIVKAISESTLAIAIEAPIKYSTPKIQGTGFVVGDGSYAITNYHVVSDVLDPSIVEHFVVLSGRGTKVRKIKATLEKIDPQHDLALLKLDEKLTAVHLSTEALLPPGSEVAFTGFPIGAILGLYPATHRGYISAITPDAIPAHNSNQLTSRMLARIENPSLIYQLDAVAYPGNSGSPVYDPTTGDIIGVINKVLVKDTKESALSAPTGISYAIPVRHVLNLMSKEQ
ncbi:trypsin-like serine protease [Alteromonas genovensis]|uniref:Trypsin-like serine protease n=1 Tax=Alteromonas genovensis TaxID=471225 RepID=A0A6N9TAJ3_9ALTE|nr:trypsin-like serine protease [Alteromonas genovensis]